MSAAENLHRLQTLDLRVDSLRQALRAAEHQLGESPELRAARAIVAEQARALQEAESRQRELEHALGQTERQLNEVEQKLYGGRVLHVKELQGWQMDAAHLRDRKARYEDQLLSAMEEVDARRAALRDAEGRLAAVEETWRRTQADLEAQITRLKDELAAAERERAAHAATIAEPHRAVYERLRRERGGRAVARIEQSTCQGCRLALPAALVQRARIGSELVYCSLCNRILWAPR
jgi:predicted  nucleic acid-binding Zn-ribbon protein